MRIFKSIVQHTQKTLETAALLQSPEYSDEQKFTLAGGHTGRIPSPEEIETARVDDALLKASLEEVAQLRQQDLIPGQTMMWFLTAYKGAETIGDVANAVQVVRDAARAQQEFRNTIDALTPRNESVGY